MSSKVSKRESSTISNLQLFLLLLHDICVLSVIPGFTTLWYPRPGLVVSMLCLKYRIWFLHLSVPLIGRAFYSWFPSLWFSEHCACPYSFRTLLIREEKSQSWHLDSFFLAAYLCLKQMFHPPVFPSLVWKRINVKINTFFHPVIVLLIHSNGFLDLFWYKGWSFNKLWTLLTSKYS